MAKKTVPLPQPVEDLMKILNAVPSAQASYEKNRHSHEILVHAAAEDETGPKEVTFVFKKDGMLKEIDLCCYKCRTGIEFTAEPPMTEERRCELEEECPEHFEK